MGSNLRKTKLYSWKIFASVNAYSLQGAGRLTHLPRLSPFIMMCLHCLQNIQCAMLLLSDCLLSLWFRVPLAKEVKGLSYLSPRAQWLLLTAACFMQGHVCPWHLSAPSLAKKTQNSASRTGKPDFSNFDLNNCVVTRVIDGPEYYLLRSRGRGPGLRLVKSLANWT